MKKALLCLLLCFCMVMPLMLAGCGSGQETDASQITSNTRDTVSISFWIVTEDETTDAAKAAVQDAFNAITETKYSTRVEFVFCTEDEYKAKLDAKFDQIDSKPAGLARPKDEQKVVVDEDGVTSPYFAPVWDYQMDILLITGKDMLDEYVADGRLLSLNDSLNNTYNKITKYIYNDILNNAKVDGSWYAVPNNHMIGEYTFMLVNKEMAQRYYYNESDFTSFGADTAAAELIDLIAQNEDLTEIAPMLGMEDYPLVRYWTQGNADKSVITTMYPTLNTQLGAGVTAVNLFSPDQKSYRSFMTQMFYCKENGYFATNQEKFGVGIVNGDYSVYQQYGDDYYISILDYPRLEEEELFSSMFAVSAYTANQGRCMEIITALTCDTELRNILQYGVEGVHYELEDGLVERKNHDYMMNINYTGNVFMAYPEEGVDPDFWTEIAIVQNQQSMLSIVFGSSSYLNKVDMEAWAAMSDVSVSYFERMALCETVSEFTAYMDAASNEITSADYYKKLTALFDDKGGYATSSINGAIQKWWTDVYGEKEEA